MLKINDSCRMCGSKNLHKFLDLGEQPLANSFVKKEDLLKPEQKFPLEVYWCGNCNLAQLIHVVDPKMMFSDYVYFSSGMPKVSIHWRDYAGYVCGNFFNSLKQFVVEIGSNDGVLLSYFKDYGHKVLGVDPAENIAEIANKRGIKTWPIFWGRKVGERIKKENGHARAILANNVFAHIDDHADFIKGVDELLALDGVLVIEAPYLLDMFKNLSYDTVYHEHLSFLAVRPMIAFFSKFGFEIFDVNLVKAQGVSLRIFVGRKGQHAICPSVFERISEELRFGLDKFESYSGLANRVVASKSALFLKLMILKTQEKSIAAYGAPAKGNTLLNYCNLDTEFLDFAVEDLPSKIGLHTPGMHIPVVSREYADANPPDYYLLLAWNYAEAILEKEKNSEFRKRGGKFVVPIGDQIELI